jgi:predicted permease
LAPGILASRAGINELLKKGGHWGLAANSHRGRFALIAFEVALSVVLLAGSGLLIRSYLKLTAVNPGFSSASLTFRVPLDERYNKPELRAAFFKTFLEKLQRIHGVNYAGASSSLPLSHHESVTQAEIRGFGKIKQVVEDRMVTPDYRKALGTPLLRGRDFTEADFNRPVVILNDRFAQIYLHGRDPLACQIRTGVGDLSKSAWLTVVGVVGNIRHNSLEETSQPQIFQPANPAETLDNFAIQSTAPAQRVIEQVRALLRSLDPALSLENVHTMRERIQESKSRRTFQTALLSGFAAIAVFLALAGLYGLMSYAVKQRTPEIAIRMAVGAQRVHVLRLILSQALGVTAMGLLIGVAAALAMTRLVSAWLFGVTPTDPITFLAVPLLVFLVASVASLLPARSATRIDPARALRQE